MKINQISFNQDKNEVKLDTVIATRPNLIPSQNNIASAISLYDSDWSNVLPIDIESAATNVLNYELPQKVPFEYSFNLEVPEVYLPFINIAILTKPITGQKLIGTGQFIYTSLQEVLLHLYTWKGITSKSAFLSNYDEVTDGSSLPSKPAPDPTFSPIPTGCYTTVSNFVSIHFFVGGGLTYLLSSDGATAYTPAPVATSTLIQSFIPPFPPGGTISVRWGFSQDSTFKYQPTHFPVPLDGESTLPCSGLVPPVGYPSQKWESEGIYTFQQYLALGYTYTQAKATFTALYPDIFITPESHGYPYKCYKRIFTDVVESGDEKIKITKTDDNNFQFSIYGDLLIVSPATVETTYSDPDFPTYKPAAAPLNMKLKISFREHPVNFVQTKAYKK